MKPEDSQQGNAQTKPKPKKRQPVKKRDPQNDKSAATFVIIGTVGAVAIGVLAYYHRDSLLAWVTFLTILSFVIAIHCHWRTPYVKRVCVFAGFALFFGCVIWQYRLMPKSEPSATSAQPSFTATTERSPSPIPTPSLSPIPERVFLDVEPEKLLDFFEKYNEAQADDLVKPYIGKWMDISGVVVSVENETIFPEGMKSVKDLIKGIRVGVGRRGVKKRSPTGMSTAQFDEQRWIDRARVLRPFKDEVKVRGQIKYIFHYGFFLDHCEIIE